MSNNLDTVLDLLRAFGIDKLAELDSRAEQRKTWLKRAADAVAQQIGLIGQAPKKQRLDDEGAARVAATEEQPIQPLPVRKGRSKAATEASDAASADGEQAPKGQAATEELVRAPARSSRRGKQPTQVAEPAEQPQEEQLANDVADQQPANPAPRISRRGRKAPEEQAAAVAGQEALPDLQQAAQPTSPAPVPSADGQPSRAAARGGRRGRKKPIDAANLDETAAAAPAPRSTRRRGELPPAEAGCCAAAQDSGTAAAVHVLDAAAADIVADSHSSQGTAVLAAAGPDVTDEAGPERLQPAKAEAAEQPVAPKRGRGRKAPVGRAQKKQAQQPADTLQADPPGDSVLQDVPATERVTVEETREPVAVDSATLPPQLEVAAAAPLADVTTAGPLQPVRADKSETANVAAAAADINARHYGAADVLKGASSTPQASHAAKPAIMPGIVSPQAAITEAPLEELPASPPAVQQALTLTADAPATQQHHTLPGSEQDAPIVGEMEQQQQQKEDTKACPSSAGYETAGSAEDDLDVGCGPGAAPVQPAQLSEAATPPEEGEDPAVGPTGSQHLHTSQLAEQADGRLEVQNGAFAEQQLAGQASAGDEEQAAKAGVSSGVAAGGAGITANLVASLRSFLPMSKPAPPPPAAGTKKPPQKLKALEAAEAARRKEAERQAERQRQKAELERQRQERVKAKQGEEARRQAEEAKRKEEARLKRDQEAAQRRREQQEAERREKEEKQRRLDEARRRKEESVAVPPAPKTAAGKPADAVAGPAKPLPAASLAPSSSGENRAPNSSLAEAKQRLLRIQEAAIQHAQQQQLGGSSGHASCKPASSQQMLELKPLGLSGAKPAATGGSQVAGPKLGVPTALAAVGAGARASQGRQTGPQTYEISPYKSDHDSDDEQPGKPVPEWAKGDRLRAQLVAQRFVDPDEIFQQHQKTCSLDEVFANGKSKQDLSRRTSSGNWIEDRVTWREEMGYKRAMGYLQTAGQG